MASELSISTRAAQLLGSASATRHGQPTMLQPDEIDTNASFFDGVERTPNPLPFNPVAENHLLRNDSSSSAKSQRLSNRRSRERLSQGVVTREQYRRRSQERSREPTRERPAERAHRKSPCYPSTRRQAPSDKEISDILRRMERRVTVLSPFRNGFVSTSDPLPKPSHRSREEERRKRLRSSTTTVPERDQKDERADLSKRRKTESLPQPVSDGVSTEVKTMLNESSEEGEIVDNAMDTSPVTKDQTKSDEVVKSRELSELPTYESDLEKDSTEREESNSETRKNRSPESSSSADTNQETVAEGLKFLKRQGSVTRQRAASVRAAERLGRIAQHKKKKEDSALAREQKKNGRVLRSSTSGKQKDSSSRKESQEDASRSTTPSGPSVSSPSTPCSLSPEGEKTAKDYHRIADQLREEATKLKRAADALTKRERHEDIDDIGDMYIKAGLMYIEWADTKGQAVKLEKPSKSEYQTAAFYRSTAKFFADITHSRKYAKNPEAFALMCHHLSAFCYAKAFKSNLHGLSKLRENLKKDMQAAHNCSPPNKMLGWTDAAHEKRQMTPSHVLQYLEDTGDAIEAQRQIEHAMSTAITLPIESSGAAGFNLTGFTPKQVVEYAKNALDVFASNHFQRREPS